MGGTIKLFAQQLGLVWCSEDLAMLYWVGDLQHSGSHGFKRRRKLDFMGHILESSYPLTLAGSSLLPSLVDLGVNVAQSEGAQHVSPPLETAERA